MQEDFQSKYFDAINNLKEQELKYRDLKDDLKAADLKVADNKQTIKHQSDKIQELTLQNQEQKAYIERLETDCKDLNDALIAEGEEIKEFKENIQTLLATITKISQDLNDQKEENKEMQKNFDSNFKQATDRYQETGKFGIRFV